MSDPLLIVAAIVILLLGNGFFSGSEIAIISSRRSRIERMAEQGSRAAQRVRELQDHMDRFLATVQIGVTVMRDAGGRPRRLAGLPLPRARWPRDGLARFLPPALVASGAVGLGIVYVELILGELVPKALALRYTERIALIVSGPFRLMVRVVALAGARS